VDRLTRGGQCMQMTTARHGAQPSARTG
jgi:hypothetical protein